MRKNKSFISILLFILTLAFLDRLLELVLKPILHRKRNPFIQKATHRFHSVTTDQHAVSAFISSLNQEADRIYAIVDRSILRERIIRAKYTFVATALAATIVVGLLGGFTGGTIMPFISPLTMAGITWITSILTIPVSYHQRVKGSIDAVILQHTNLFAKTSLTSNELIRKGLAANDPAIKEAASQQRMAPAATPVTNLLQLDDALGQMEEGRMTHPDIIESTPAAAAFQRP